MPAHGDLDRDRITRLLADELVRFRADRPVTMALLERARAHMPNGVPMAWMASDNDQPVYIARGEGAGFTDVDGFTYLDTNASDMAMFGGHANPAIVRAVTDQAARSTQFLLPTEDSIAVAEELARRYPGQTHWQFTLSATQANTEAIRLARAVTGREVVVLFAGHYHGHFEENMVDDEGGGTVAVQRGLSKGVTGRVRIAQYNDPDSLREALAPGDVAIVLTVPAMTNQVHMLLPEPGWHDELRARTRDHDVLLAIDETHTHVIGEGGATGRWRLEPDVVTIGKAVAGGIPMGVYGVTPALAPELAAERNVAVDPRRERLAEAALPWTTIRFGPRSGQWYGPQPRTGADAYALADMELTRLLRVWLANRGVWEALPGAGPTVPIPATETDVDRYVTAYGELLAELVA